MERHPTDGLSLATGAVFTVLGLAYLFGLTPALRLRPQWIGPVVLLIAGAWVLVASRGRADHRAE